MRLLGGELEKGELVEGEELVKDMRGKMSHVAEELVLEYNSGDLESEDTLDEISFNKRIIER